MYHWSWINSSSGTFSQERVDTSSSDDKSEAEVIDKIMVVMN